MIPQPIVELVVLKSDPLETLLIPRPKGDEFWPGMFHAPGTALRLVDFRRAGKNPLNGAFERLARDELKNPFEPLTFVTRLHRLAERGAEVAEVYYAKLAPGSVIMPDHVWYPVDQIPNHPNIVPHHIEQISLAADAYRARLAQ